ncbi:MAG: septal ring lytic transglycosylase RlpA family protein [Geobacter sp.]|nr:septal ring lytic transglycosylase RlpA family protein [Geobacter sp.]
MKHQFFNTIALSVVAAALFLPVTPARAVEEQALGELTKQQPSVLEELLLKSSPLESVDAVATYYANRFEGRQTASGHRYNPDKLTAAHESLPLGTVVRVLNPETKQEVHVTITDRCASKAYHFIDLSRAAAKKIGLWGKGKLKVVIYPLLEEKLKEPA